MATANAKIFRVATPPGFSYTFDRTDVNDGVLDNAATATSAGAAINAITTLIGALPGTFTSANITVITFE